MIGICELNRPCMQPVTLGLGFHIKSLRLVVTVCCISIFYLNHSLSPNIFASRARNIILLVILVCIVPRTHAPFPLEERDHTSVITSRFLIPNHSNETQAILDPAAGMTLYTRQPLSLSHPPERKALPKNHSIPPPLPTPPPTTLLP
jgi:hypothetical protein